GVSVYRESIALDERLAGPGLRLLDALDWQGGAMIECKREAETGRQVVMEVNGRFWGSLQLAIDAGIDFPALLVRCAAGERVPECRDYRVGIRSRWFWGDVDHLYLRLRDGRARLQALRAFLRVSRRDRSEVWRWRAPLPRRGRDARLPRGGQDTDGPGCAALLRRRLARRRGVRRACARGARHGGVLLHHHGFRRPAVLRHSGRLATPRSLAVHHRIPRRHAPDAERSVVGRHSCGARRFPE